uniref:Integral membrane bound transporter domain-containing protein n=1 Tax=Oryza meridionalis TaxID=40149 RepID=A0A0E0F164_9ORYZ
MPPSSAATTGGAVHKPIIMPPESERQINNLPDVLQPRRRWRSSLATGFRSALACTIVGVASIYAPLVIRRHLTFPAFSYVVTVIVVTDATLGSSLRGALSAVHATAMGAVPSVLPLWLAHRTGAGESVLATTAVVALSTFAVAVAGSAGAVAKRIALGQIIIIYVARFREERMRSEAVLLHPANVVACTALGVVAALLGVLLPCPRLATRDATDKRLAYLEVAAERVKLLADAFQLQVYEAAGDIDDEEERTSSCRCRRRRRQCVAACIMSQADRAASAGALLLRRISSAQGDLQWERMPALLKRWCSSGDDDDEQTCARLHELIEMPLRGMEMACTHMLQQPCWPNTTNTNSSICTTPTWLQHATDHVRLALLTKRIPSCSKTGTGSMEMAKLAPVSVGAMEQQQLAPFLFLLCLDLLQGSHPAPQRPPKLLLSVSAHSEAAASQVKVIPAATTKDDDEEQPEQRRKKKHQCPRQTTTSTMRRLVAAAKCSFSLGLAVLLGLLFSSDHGFWSGLIVATTMATGREWTWALAIARAHGTALGSVYGALACLVIDLMELRFLALLPWLILTAGFLKRSRAYGPAGAGGVAAAVSGIIIVGRRYDEPPMAFTVARLVETFIGLACIIVADLVFQPAARPSTKATAQLDRCLAALKGCFSRGRQLTTKVKVKAVQEQVALLERCVAEAAGEPHFPWSPPFPASCYHKVAGSLGRMAQLLYLYTQAHPNPIPAADEDATQRFQCLVSASLERSAALLLRLSRISSSRDEEDLEAGIRVSSSSDICCCDDDEAPEMLVRSFLSQQQQQQDQGAALALASIGFCMGEMAKEALQLEAYMLDLILLAH